MSNFVPLGPKRPIKKPSPKIVEFVNNDCAFVDAQDGFQVGSEIFVCTEETTPIFEKLQSDTYTLSSGDNFVVINGVIDEIL